ncbi:hypothetical protein HFV04_013035 [Pseudomonas sp. BIGb0427]|uniref:hypothetical protein n=1 Tax=unclassified Pseudomonas TaxID=196821 RepID=UPI0016A2795F|nr:MULTISPECIES: hypothetical protein [unclassified Pseudomonas]NLU59125.1 hypothetical protein [Pseudomonas sp. BIGb0427]QPG65655.1 hypothetical protein HFV04_013035 [Pseudomonas sp. BIGb0427]UVM57168.1 hypothetical protein LOY37_06160 [Pseudomonas sp. B21-012]UVM68102.1 hypothetical protein LOY34_06090 [Pseudomonas sp. B21-009]
MQKQNLFVTHGGTSYAGYDYEALPLEAALVVVVQQIDLVADQSRVAILGETSRLSEYLLVEQEARVFADIQFEGEMPLAVKAWADAANLSPQAAAESILAEAHAWKTALYAIRAARLKGKQSALKAGSHEEAEAIADQAIAAIRASVVGVGNA